jgi:glucose-1-phosphate thymidylyltransferase
MIQELESHGIGFILIDSEKMKGIILHGGQGTRLRPLTHTGPKQLIPVANKPISQYVLENLREVGITDIAIVLGDLYPEKVKGYYGDGRNFGVKLSYIYQAKPGGIAQAVGLCEDFISDNPFVVYLGDNLLKGGIKLLAQAFENSGADAMVLLCEVENPEKFGVARFEGKRLVGLVEKPKQPPSNYALTGVYFFKPIIFEMIKQLKPSWRGELEITDAIQMLMEKGYKVNHDFITGWWKDTGSPEDILEANRFVLDGLKARIEGEIEEGASIQGRVVLEKSSLIKRGALVRGPAIIGNSTVAEPRVYIGPYTSVGKNVEIRRGEIENSIIMDHCLIDVDERIVDSLIAPHSKIVSNENKPRGKRFILGERSHVEV